MALKYSLRLSDMIEEHKVDLLVSHRQIRLENRPFDDAYCDWGMGNIRQGCIINDGFVIFDPIVDGTFGAYVHFSVVSRFEVNVDCQRCIVTNVHYTSEFPLLISSAFERVDLNVSLESGVYNLYFEIIEKDEVYYKFTMTESSQASRGAFYVINDDFGGVEGSSVYPGKIDD